MDQEILFSDFSYLELWWPFVQQSRTIYTNLEGNMGNIQVKLFEIGTSGSGRNVAHRRWRRMTDKEDHNSSP